ncbi:MAG: hypothetical protein N3I86_16380, partial [Verrucomicrobiae bacterium]|nr:hypothetical protein [Verrucomicrobiae bacterium]
MIPEKERPTIFSCDNNNSRRIYVNGKVYPFIRVPMREVELSPTRLAGGGLEINEPVRIYDCSGAWGDPDFNGNISDGLPKLRQKWILERADVEEYEGVS